MKTRNRALWLGSDRKQKKMMSRTGKDMWPPVMNFLGRRRLVEADSIVRAHLSCLVHGALSSLQRGLTARGMLSALYNAIRYGVWSRRKNNGSEAS